MGGMGSRMGGMGGRMGGQPNFFQQSGRGGKLTGLFKAHSFSLIQLGFGL